MLRLYRFPLSTNVDRVALALAYKGLAVESVPVDPADRREVRRVSGQDLVPVLVDGDTIVSDSTAILRHLETRFPDPPLFPRDPARRAEVDIFLDWFNRVWKVPPNAIEAELGKPAPDSHRIPHWGHEMADALDLFEALLAGRAHLMGDGLSAADVAAYPFLKYALEGERRLAADCDPYLFHRILVDHQPLGDDHPRLADWIRRMDRLPLA